MTLLARAGWPRLLGAPPTFLIEVILRPSPAPVIETGPVKVLAPLKVAVKLLFFCTCAVPLITPLKIKSPLTGLTRNAPPPPPWLTSIFTICGTALSFSITLVTMIELPPKVKAAAPVSKTIPIYAKWSVRS